MHAVGIKRVFWTNAAGQWEGAKVRTLVEALDCDAARDADALETADDARSAGLGMGMFVTKHEILMLRRMTLEG